MKPPALHPLATTRFGTFVAAARLPRAFAFALAAILAWLGLLGLAHAKLPATAFPRLDTTELALEIQAAANLTLSLPGPAGVAQTYIVLTTRPDLLQVPNRVTLPVGARSVSVPIQALAAGVGLVRVIANTRQLAATVTVINGEAQLKSVQPLPASVGQGADAHLLFELTAVPRTDVTLALSANPVDALSLPAQVVVPAGSQRAEVTVRALQAGAHTVRAELGADHLEATLRVTPAAPAVLALQPSRSEVEVGAPVSLNVLLNGFSPTPIEVALAATPADVLQLPATVTVPAGADRADVSGLALKLGTAQIDADAGTHSASAEVVVREAAGAAVPPQLSLRPPELLLSLGATGNVIVELDAVRAYDQVLSIVAAQQVPANGGGAVVVVPASLVIAAGQRSANFQVAAVATGTAQVTLTPNNSKAVTTLGVAVADGLSQITALSPTKQTLPKGTVGQAVVHIAPGSSAQHNVAVSADPSNVVSLPSTVTVPAGQTHATIPLAARSEGEAQIRATLNGSDATAQITVGAAVVEELRAPASFSLGVGATARIPVQALMTDGALLDDPEGLQVGSDKPEVLAVDTTGALTGVATGSANVELRLGNFKLRVPVTVVAQPQLQLSPTNTELIVGGSAIYTVSTSTAAPAGGLSVELSYSGQGSVEMPSSVSIAANTSATTFTVKALSEGTVTLRADASGRQPATATLVKKLPVLAITSATPLRGPAGTVVTITGSGFDEQANINTVYIGNVALEIVSSSTTQLVVRVPINAVTGELRIVNPLGSVTGPTFTVEQSQDANLAATPDSVRLLRGSEATAAIVINSLGTQAYTGAMSLSISGLPAGVTASFDPQTLPAERSGILRLQADDSIAPGSYQLQVSGVGHSTAGSITRTATLAVNVPDPAVTPSTGVRGRFITPEGQPIAGVIVRADSGGNNSPSINTDASGSFEFAGMGAGALTLRFDATPANPLYPIWPYSVTIVADQMIVLKDFVISPPPETQTYNAISNATSDQKVTDERFPGLEITLPAGAEIVGWDGVKKTQIAVEKREISELPVPPPPVATGAAYQIYFGTPSGGIPSKPIPITLPNDSGALPGESVEVLFFDGSPMGGSGEWKVAGEAIVSADGKVAKMTEGGLTRFCGVCGLACLAKKREGWDKTCPTGGNPVSLYAGQELPRTGGLSCGGYAPIETGRNYNPTDAFGNVGGTEGSIGYGWTLDYDVMFLGGAQKRIVMPGNQDFDFTAEPDGTYRNRDEPRFDGAVARPVGQNWELTFKDKTVWKFQPYSGAPGRVFGVPQFLTEVLQPNGKIITIRRNTRGQLLSVGTERRLVFFDGTNAVQSAERRITASYGSSGFIEALTDPEGRSERYSYTASKRLETVIDPDGRVTRYTYVASSALPSAGACSATGGLIGITNASGLRQLLPIAVPDPGEHIKTITYPGLSEPTENFYGSSGRVLRQITADGREFRFSYRLSGACVTHTSDSSKVIDTTSSGINCLAIGCPRGPLEDNWENFQAGWRVRGGDVLATTVRNPDGTTTTARFGNKGQLLEYSTSGGDRNQYVRDANNRITRITDSLGRVMRRAYDANGNITRIADPLGRFTDFTYDSRWNKATTITRYSDDGTAQIWTLTYDNRGNVSEVSNPLGHKLKLDYNSVGQVVGLTDPLDQITRIAYTAAGDLTKLTDPLGNTASFDTDASGRPTSTTDPLGYTTTEQTNGIGQTTQVEDAIGGKTTMAYDGGARLKSVTNPRGNAIASYGYDANGRLTARTDGVGKNDLYTYDSAGRIESTVDRKGQTTRYNYDAAGRLSSIQYPDRTRSFSYDGANRVVTLEEGSSRVDVEYDLVDRVVKEAQTNNGRSYELTYGYDKLDRRISRKVNGADETRYEWDLGNRLAAMRFAGESTLYDWDDAGRLTRKTLPNGVTADYAYDAAGRLLSMTYKTPAGAQIEQITYTYDARGMRTSKALASGGVIADTPISAEYDSADRMTSVKFTATGETCALTYDANGNMARKDCGSGTVTTYVWDALDRLTGIAGPGLDAVFAYDVFGRRISRTVNGVTTNYVYDGAQAVGEIVGGSSTQLLTGLAIDEAIATYNTGKRRYALTDALGSVLADLQPDGMVAASRAYSAYGESTSSGEARSSSNGYTAREDDKTGLMFYRARYYDPVLKRFVAEDPIGLRAGINHYEYVFGNPAQYTDPSGEYFWWAARLAAQAIIFWCKRHPVACAKKVGQFAGALGTGIAGVRKLYCSIFGCGPETCPAPDPDNNNPDVPSPEPDDPDTDNPDLHPPFDDGFLAEIKLTPHLVRWSAA